MRLKILFAATVLLVARVVQAADPQPYSVQIASTGNGALNAALHATSQLESLRTSAPVGPFALVDRAQQDIGRLQTALDSFGYYRGHATITIGGHALDDPDLPTTLQALGKGKSVKVEVRIVTGVLFRLRKVSLEGSAVNPAALAAFALKSGDPAVAADVLTARQRLLEALEEQGHAYARVSEPTAYEDAQQPVLDVTFMLDAGPSYVLGPIRIEGLKHVSEAFLRRQLLVHAGEPYSPSKVERARAALLALGVFSSVTARLPPRSQAKDGRVPIEFVTVERAPHTVTLNAAYSSDLGASAGATWTDRNLFGGAEQLTLNASMINLGGTASNGLGYDLGAQLLKPDFFATNQSLQFSLVALKQQLEAYNQIAATGGATVSRKLSSVWNVSAGVTLEQERILQNEVIDCTGPWSPNPLEPQAKPPSASWCTYTLFSVPLSARYDSTDLANPLNDPLHGLRASVSVTPTESLFGHHASFLIMQVEASTYFDLARLGWSQSGRSVFALRALAGQARGAGQFSLPPDLRFYAGGSATVRGYAYQTVGKDFPPPDTPGEYPEGGTGLATGTVEFRQRVWHNFGLAAFVDAGEVSASGQPFAGAFSVGYGLGPRYYTPIGPIRLDVAFPATRLPHGDALEVYIGLGQAF
ncbi:MAG TPA: BamA/TamA family outer membrane protein [Steroidobacteraceae bacterium]|jgi:translocation and assembly module TamA|nr:BamA/TamA family outer membrane protein [Steroidobacteraceae bacterium]